jgi:diguanylate cyclase (GGDEF)-like protein
MLTAVGGLLAGLAAAGGLLYRQQQLLAAARHEASHDELTGLPNRRALTAHLRTAVRRAERIAVALLDVDQFKDVNDKFGHAAGDIVLRTIAARLRALPPPVRLAARLSGDEFALLITGDRDTATEYARLAWQVICADPIPLGGTLLDVSVSVGVAAWRLGLDERHLLHDADQAMYLAKSAGGGVHTHTAQPGSTEILQRPAVRCRDRRHP